MLKLTSTVARAAPFWGRSLGNFSQKRGLACTHDAEKMAQLIHEKLMGSDPYLADILENNKKWVKATNDRDPSFFPSIAKQQNPRYLYVGCSDARVDPTILMGLKYGELFIHRNVGNVVSGTDLNFLSVLEFAVTRLKVPQIIVCGHYDCGAVRGSSTQADHGIIENWLRNIRDVQRLHREELQEIPDPEARHRRLVELNVIEQCFNIMKTGCVQRLRAQSNQESGLMVPRVHGLVFDPADGVLKKLKFKTHYHDKMIQYEDIYNLYPEDQ